MEIYINEQKIDFTLEGGETSLDLYKTIRTFLSGSGHHIYSFSVDGEETDPEKKEDWGKRVATDIKRIDVTALTENEYKLTGLLTIAEYINLLINSVTENKKDTLSALIEDFPSIYKNISLLVSGEEGKLISSHLAKIMEKSGLLNNQFNEEYRSDFLKEIGSISELISSASREIENPLSELQNSVKALEVLNPRLSDVSILLQTGKDKEAMAIVISLTEILQKIIRLLSLYDTDNIDIEKLNSILAELAEAFGAGDSVLIGDLLEYEISPMVDQLSTAIESIKKMEG